MRPPFLRWILALVLLIAGAGLLYRLRSVLLLFVLALFLTYLIEPLVAALERRGAPRDAAILSVFLAAAILAAGGIALVLPALAGEIEGAIGVLPEYLRRLGRIAAAVGEFYRRFHLPANLRIVIERLTAQATTRIERFLGSAFSALIGLLPRSFSLLLVPFIAYYLSRDYHAAARYVRARLRAREDLLERILAIDRTLRSYFQALALELSVTTGLLVAGLSFLRLEFALLVGVAAGILNVIPYFGPLLGAIPAVLLALARSPWSALYVVVLFLAVNQFEASVLIPRLLGRRVGLHPLLVLFALLAGGELFGLPGLILAVPAAAVLKAVLVEYLRRPSTARPDLTTPGASGMIVETEEDSKENDGG